MAQSHTTVELTTPCTLQTLVAWMEEVGRIMGDQDATVTATAPPLGATAGRINVYLREDLEE